MLSRLLGIIFGLLLVAGCAQLPQVELEIVRAEVAKAYAGGAKVLAPQDYESASSALHDAEVHVSRGRYAQAREALNLALLHATKAAALAGEKSAAIEKQRRAEEELKARQKAREEARLKAARKKQAKPKPKPKPAPPKPKIVLVDKVSVSEDDTLFSLAARKDVYADGLLWPLIYKANRDQIKDPVRIFVGQEFAIPRDKSVEEQAAARKEALDSGLFQAQR